VTTGGLIVPAAVVTLFLCGDVMLGRGVDQILPHPGDPALREGYMRDAGGYIELAERVNGPIPRPVDVTWPWGEALQVLDDADPELRIINLETAITRSDAFAVGKAVHYRMSPANLGCLAVARPDVCVLANNHVLDFGVPGLLETLDELSAGGLTFAGAGGDLGEARRPAEAAMAGGGRVLVLAVAMASSGVPAGWAAAGGRPGVAFFDGPSPAAADEVVGRVRRHRRPGDLVVVSVHWGSNWGDEIPREQIRFAHTLIDGGVDLVHGHSSHHPRPLEVYRDRLILYGCGDLINDYEGISGHERYRGDLRLLYLATLARHTGALIGLRMVPLQARRLRLEHVSFADADGLARRMDRISRPFGVGIGRGPDGTLELRHRPGPGFDDGGP
jgi:poly-gamma-glutamate capsule biosynthesis protein CapA/YwtB (metallophosphatase superfamily)